GAANDSNDESLLVIEDAGVAKKFSDEFQRLYSTARFGAPASLIREIHDRTIACGHSQKTIR
ncbi:MAG: competence protein ComE, partial [Bdellovibrionota bacterium]